MPIYTHNGNMGPAVNISTFVAGAQVTPAGPLPHLPGPVNYLGVNATGVVALGPVPAVTKAGVLITCAAVIYVSNHPGAAAAAWVHHANAGHVGGADVTAARAGLGNPPANSLLVIVAHPGPHDPGYATSIATIVGQGVNANNIVEIPNLIVPEFGIDNLGMIG